MRKKTVIWPDLDAQIRIDLRNHIKKTEQYNVDAYTQQKLNNGTEHIDHFKKRAHFPQLCFDYENLFVANQNAAYGASYKDKNIKKEDYEAIYNPALYMHKFKFSFDGSIAPLKENDKKAEKTIEVFNLDDKVLKRRRQAIFRNAKNMSKQIPKNEIIKTFKYEFHSGIAFLLG